MNEVIDCRQCPRLVAYLQHTRQEHPDYYCKPVPAFGPDDIRLLIVGLAPGKHGANATGIPFTGDAAGILLYRTLYEFGFSSHAQSTLDNSPQLYNCRITNAVKCLPPQNKPLSSEINQCNAYLEAELSSLADNSVILALGQIAHKAIVKALALRQVDFPFAHGEQHRLHSRLQLIDSYHCSRYNTQTRRLTESMFRSVFQRIYELLEVDPQHA